VSSAGGRVEVVRGRLHGYRAEQVIRFWADRVGLDEAAALERLPQVVCVLIDENDELAGVNSVFEDAVPAFGGRTLWVYRALIAPEVEQEASAPMVAAAFAELERNFSEGSGPIGMCLQISDPSVFPDHRQAFWADLGMLYAGYLEDGRQLRIRYFEGARI
jgi:hypothetical protein